MPAGEQHTTPPIRHWRDDVIFESKAGGLRLKRTVADLFDPKVRRHPPTEASGVRVLSEVVTDLYTETAPEESGLQLGKVHNLRLGARAINGVRLAPGEVFSFWAQLGRPTRSRGYLPGRELRQGCIIPTLGGGLCQLSNSLYKAARLSGCDILERHGHTAPIANSPFPAGEDATVFWNYVDLRFRARQSLVVRARLTDRSLIVAIEADE